MNGSAKLTRRETEIAELFAWGASKKEVADRLYVSERTVENHARNIYRKTGCGKVNELAAWWFCTRFHISFDLSPLKRKAGALLLAALLVPQAMRWDGVAVRVSTRARTCRQARRRTDDEGCTFIYEL